MKKNKVFKQLEAKRDYFVWPHNMGGVGKQAHGQTIWEAGDPFESISISCDKHFMGQKTL